ncbi:MAG: hypothetical protein PCFJNLEI_00649 [Verrucomicrobiae bacterium]|nr:hypothetical protein [Verrucomicrobiae bacterium]
MSFIATIFGGGSQDNTDAHKRKTIVAIVAVVVIIGSIGWLARTMLPTTPKINLAPFIGVGETLAEQTAKVLSGHGRIVVLRESVHLTESVVIKSQWKAFQDSLKANSNIEIAAVENIKMTEQNPGITITREEFDTLLKKYSTVNAIVSFVGLPEEDLSRPDVPAGPTPKIIAYFYASSPAKQFFANGSVTVIIRPRLMAEVNTGATPKSPREWFNKYYQVFDESNYQTMPE